MFHVSYIFQILKYLHMGNEIFHEWDQSPNSLMFHVHLLHVGYHSGVTRSLWPGRVAVGVSDIVSSSGTQVAIVARLPWLTETPGFRDLASVVSTWEITD